MKMDAKRFQNKMNIVQIAETSGFSVFDIDFYTQSGPVRKQEKHLLLHPSP